MNWFRRTFGNPAEFLMNLATMGLYGFVKDRTSSGEFNTGIDPNESLDKVMDDVYEDAVSSTDTNAKRGYSYDTYYNEMPDFNSPEGDGLRNWWYGQTGAGLTAAQEAQMQYNTAERIAGQNFTHNEAVDARMWEQYVANNKYQWETNSMQQAGLNPAMMYGQGNMVPTNATGAMGSSNPATAPNANVGDIGSLLMSLIRMPLELKAMKTKIKGEEIDNGLKQKELDNADESISLDLQIKSATVDEIRQKIEESQSRVDNNEMDTKLKEAGITTEEAKQALYWAQVASVGLDNELKEKLNPLLVREQELQNSLLETQDKYAEQKILAELAEVRAHTTALYAQAAVDGARKQNISLQNSKLKAESGFWHTNAQNAANALKWNAEGQRQTMKQKFLQTDNAQYYHDHYEEAFRNSWSQSGVEWGITEQLGQALGTAALLGTVLAF